MGFEGGIYSPPQTTQSVMVHLALNNLDNQNTIDKLQQDRQYLQNELNRTESAQEKLYRVHLAQLLEKDVIQDKSNEAKERFENQTQQQREELKMREEGYSQDKEKLRRSFERDRKSYQTELASQDYDKKTIVALEERLEDSLDQSLRYQREMTRLNKGYTDLRGEMYRRVSEEDKLDEAIAAYNQDRDNKFLPVREQMVKKEIDLVKAQESLLAQLDELIATHQSLLDYQRQMKDSEGALDEKRTTISALAGQLDSFKEKLAQKEEMIMEQKEQLASLEQQLNDNQK